MVEKLPSSSENSQSMVEKLPRSMVEKLPLLNTERLSKKKIDTSVSIDSETEPTKTSKKPTSPNTESQRIIEKCFLDAYQEDFNDKPKMNYALNRKLINECLKTHSAEHVCRIIEVARHDKFIKDRGLFDLPQILSASIYNRLSKNVTHNKRDVPKCPVCNRRLIGVLCPKCNERKDA